MSITRGNLLLNNYDTQDNYVTQDISISETCLCNHKLW